MYLKPNAPAAASAGKSVIGFNVIHGREVEGDLGMIESRSAVDRRDLVGMFPDSGEKDVTRAAKGALDALPAWSATPVRERAALIQRIGDGLVAHQESFIKILTREIGWTRAEAQHEIEDAIHTCRRVAAGERPVGHALPTHRPHRDLSLRRQPVGVMGLLAAGSLPLALPARKILSALLGGNTVVWKPSEDAPTVAYLFLRAMMEAGLPPGVVNTVNGRGRAACGKHFLGALDKGFFQAFSFAGSPTLGRTVGELCGRNHVPVSMDLGRKGPLIVLPDADLEQAVAIALQAAFTAGGQRGTGLSNILLPEACAAEFSHSFQEAVNAFPVGNPLTDPDVTFGPMINGRFAEAFRLRWELGREEGAQLRCGGAQWTEENRTDHVLGPINHGIYHQACVWDHVTPAMELFGAEAFGPSVNLVTVRDAEEALAIARELPPSHTASIFTWDRAWMERFKREVQATSLGINTWPEGREAHLATGGHVIAQEIPSGQDGLSRWQTVVEQGNGPLPVPVDGAASKKTTKTEWDEL